MTSFPREPVGRSAASDLFAPVRLALGADLNVPDPATFYGGDARG
jgi:hypothetical protein